MAIYLRKYSQILPFAFILLLSTFLIFLSQHPMIGLPPQAMVWGIGLDFILTMPLVYLLLIWKRSIPKLSVVPVILLGSFLAHRFLPLEQISFFVYFQALCIPMMELSLMGLVGHKIYKLYQTYPRGENLDVFAALKSTCREVIPGLAGRFLAMELATFYYGFFAPPLPKPKLQEFSYHKESGVISVLGVLIFLILIETLALHLLLQLWSNTAALILTILSLYTALQFWGTLRSIPRRLIRVDAEKGYLRVYFGILSEAHISLDHISSWKAKPGLIPQSTSFEELSLLGSLGGGYNFLISVEIVGEIQGFYGKKIAFQNLAFFVDNPEGLAQALSEVKKS